MEQPCMINCKTKQSTDLQEIAYLALCSQSVAVNACRKALLDLQSAGLSVSVISVALPLEKVFALTQVRYPPRARNHNRCSATPHTDTRKKTSPFLEVFLAPFGWSVTSGGSHSDSADGAATS